MTRPIFDTNILMGTEDYKALVSEFNKDGKPYIALESLRELDSLKKSRDERKAKQSQRAIKKIRENIKEFEFVNLREALDYTPDSVDDAIVNFAATSETLLVTNDFAMEVIAEALGVDVSNYFEVKDVGKGWIEVDLELYNEKDIVKHLSLIGAELEVGEYLIVNNFKRNFGTYQKVGETSYKELEELAFENEFSGTVRAKNPQQLCAMNTLSTKQLTVITGSAGSGKTLLSISKMLDDLLNGAIQQIVIFTNPTKARGAEELGFYTGDRKAKLLQNSIGAILTSKLGPQILERYLEMEKILIMPMSDIRGYEVPGSATLYITEAQNADADLLQLAIQRGSTGDIIVEGDPYSQLDHWSYGGENNGMLRLIEVFKKYKHLPRFQDFGHVHLDKIFRSEIAERANLMTSE